MIVGVMMLSVIAALGAALASLVLGYGLVATLGFYMLGGAFGMLSVLLIAFARQYQQTEPQLVHSNP